MNLRAGDKPKVRRKKDLLCEFKVTQTDYGLEIDPGLHKPFFVASMFKYCGDEIEITFVSKDIYCPYMAHGYYWTDDFFEGSENNV